MSTRRDFIRTSAGAGVGAALGALPKPLEARAPNIISRRVTPVCVASGNGLGAVSWAIEELANGASTIEAVVRGVNLVEEDPNDSSVGYGGCQMSTVWYSLTPLSCMVQRVERALSLR